MLLVLTLTGAFSGPSGPQGPSGAKLHKDLLKDSFSEGEFGAFNAVQGVQNFNQELHE